MRRALGILIILMLASSAESQDGMTISIGGSRQSSCPGSRNGLLAGSIARTTVVVSAEAITYFGLTRPIAPDPPVWLSLEFNDCTAQEGRGAAANSITETLRYRTSLKQLQEASPAQDGSAWFRYEFTVPSWTESKVVCLTAKIVHSRGDASPKLKSEAVEHFIIDPVCSKEDADRVLYSFVNSEWDFGDYATVVRTADSLLHTGWQSQSGLWLAKLAAHQLNDYRSCIEFLDSMYSFHGTVSPYAREETQEHSAEIYRRYRESYIKSLNKIEK
ncbi:MAG: hypothetical protein IPH10_02535 [bacterium]|nr:hypothetical protein [bacterium]